MTTDRAADRPRRSGRPGHIDRETTLIQGAWAPPGVGGRAKTWPRGTRGMTVPVRLEGRCGVTMRGCPQTGAGMGLAPVLGVGGRRRGGLVKSGWRLAVGQEDDAAGMVDLFGARVQPIR